MRMAELKVTPDLFLGYKRIFDVRDKNNDGFIPPRKWFRLLKKMGVTIDWTELKEEGDNDGKRLDFTKFVYMMNCTIKEIMWDPNNNKILKFAFNAYDKDDNGYISFEEMRLMMNVLEEDITDEDICNLMHVSDKNPDQKICQEEFVKMMKFYRKYKNKRRFISKKANQTPAERFPGYKRIFDRLDGDSNGFIPVQKWAKCKKEMGDIAKRSEIAEQVKAVDLDNDGRLNFTEFVDRMNSSMKEVIWDPNNNKILKFAFKAYDKDDSGCVSFEEVRVMMTALEEDISVEDIVNLMHASDNNPDQKISQEEFVKMMKFYRNYRN